MPIKVGMVSLGCSKNQVDAEHILFDLRQFGYELCVDSGICDAVVINTCGFIEEAKQEAIENILEFVKLKEEGKIKVIAVTGCLAERYQNELVSEIPEIDIVLGIGSNKELPAAIERALKGEKTVKFGNKSELSLEGGRIISNLPFYAYLKIAEGCNNRCTYCAIPQIRGKYRSRTIESIVKEAEYFAENGVTELIVVAQDTTLYGVDLYKEQKLPQLLKALCEIKNIKWIRLLYTYPDKITDELIDTVANEPKIVKYFDIPLQHVSDNVLKRMNRSGSREFYLSLIKKIRDRIPGVILRTTFLTGFPGETEKDFEELCEFADEVRFERLGCFAFSPEEGTPAAEMPDQIDDEIKRRRSDLIMTKQMTVIEKFNESQIGKTLEVVVEGYDKYAGGYFGRSAYDAPDIDAKVFFSCDHHITVGDYINVHITDTLEYDLLGEAE